MKYVLEEADVNNFVAYLLAGEKPPEPLLKAENLVKEIAVGKVLDTENTKNTLKFVFESGGYDFVNFPYGQLIKLYIQKKGEK